MTDRRTFTLKNPVEGRQTILSAWRWAKAYMKENGCGLVLTLQKATRSVEQNSILWSILTDIAQQVEWSVNGTKRLLGPEDWKDILSAGLKTEQQLAAGLHGNFVALGQRTSRMTKAELSELLELAWAFGSEREVKWSRTSLGREMPPEATQ